MILRKNQFLVCGLCTIWIPAEEAVRHHAVPSAQTPLTLPRQFINAETHVMAAANGAEAMLGFGYQHMD